MKLTKQDLVEILKEEFNVLLKEGYDDELYQAGGLLELTVSDDGYEVGFEKLDSAEEYVNNREGAYAPSVKMLVQIVQVAPEPEY
tara:strand:+ start:308 stop:562 length:255 start_codon:yes stop_codon:yes gene_type:complete